MSLGLGWERSSGPAWGSGEAPTGCSRHPTSHPFPFGRGRNGSLTSPAASAPSLGEGRGGRRDLPWRRSVGLEKGRRRGGGWRDWASSGLSARRVELGAWQPCRFSFFAFSGCTQARPFLGVSPVTEEGPRSLL